MDPTPTEHESRTWVASCHQARLRHLARLEELAEDQLQLCHLEPSTSRHNTPIFVIKKKSGNIYKLLHDLRVINEHMEKIGTAQAELPHSSAILSHPNIM